MNLCLWTSLVLLGSRGLVLQPSFSDDDLTGLYSRSTGFIRESVTLRKGSAWVGTFESDVDEKRTLSGTWSPSKASLHLHFQSEQQDRRTLVPVRWDGVMCLVDADDIDGFVNQLNRFRADTSPSDGVFTMGHEWFLCKTRPPSFWGKIEVPASYLLDFSGLSAASVDFGLACVEAAARPGPHHFSATTEFAMR